MEISKMAGSFWETRFLPFRFHLYAMMKFINKLTSSFKVYTPYILRKTIAKGWRISKVYQRRPMLSETTHSYESNAFHVKALRF